LITDVTTFQNIYYYFVGSTRDWSHIINQIGMFCYTGMTEEQVKLFFYKLTFPNFEEVTSGRNLMIKRLLLKTANAAHV